MKKRLTTEQFIARARTFHDNKFDYSQSIYVNDKTKVAIICPEHGKFWTLPASHFRSIVVGGCSKCAGNILMTTEQFIVKAKSIHGNKYDYSLVNYEKNSVKVKIVCSVHGAFDQLPTNHYKYGCLACSGKETLSLEDFIERSSIVHDNRFSYDLVDYHGMFTKVKIICHDHGMFEQLPTNHLHNKRGCPRCSKRISKGERSWLNNLGLPNDKDHRNVFFFLENNKIYVDGYDPITNTIYEFNGDYWHGNPKLYESSKIHPVVKKSFGELYRRTVEKEGLIRQAGFNLITIWESDYVDNQSNHLK